MIFERILFAVFVQIYISSTILQANNPNERNGFREKEITKILSSFVKM